MCNKSEGENEVLVPPMQKVNYEMAGTTGRSSNIEAQLNKVAQPQEEMVTAIDMMNEQLKEEEEELRRPGVSHTGDNSELSSSTDGTSDGMDETTG